MTKEKFDEDYFIRGKESGKSLYENYRWLPELTIPMAERIVDHLGIQKNETVLDFGCARGYLVKALRLLGINAFGYDCSSWAIENSDEETKQYLTNNPEIWATNTPEIWAESKNKYDWIIAKDVLEHIEYVQWTLDKLIKVANKGLFVVVPLSQFDSLPYIIEEYEKDITHVHRLTLISWIKKLERRGWDIHAGYRVPGIKDNYYKPGWEKGNGFITLKRVIG